MKTKKTKIMAICLAALSESFIAYSQTREETKESYRKNPENVAKIKISMQ